jgi:hypothetical protein
MVKKIHSSFLNHMGSTFSALLSFISLFLLLSLLVTPSPQQHRTAAALSHTIYKTSTRTMTMISTMMATKEGRLNCACGKVSFHITMPFSSYGIAKQTCAYCQCHDCRTYAQAVQSYRMMDHVLSDHDDHHHPNNNNNSIKEQWPQALEASNATCMRQFYKSDLSSVIGMENLGACQLKATKDAIATRYYSLCCGSPLLLWYHAPAPFAVVMTKYLDHGTLPRIQPTVVINHASAPPHSASLPSGVMVRMGFGAPIFLLRLLWRLLWGLLLGKGKTLSKDVEQMLTTVVPVIGIDNILRRGERTKKEE